MDGITIYASAFDVCAAYDTDTQCRMIGYMARYALTGEEPVFAPDDPARYIWPALREKADRITESYERKSAAGRQGGIAAQADRKQKSSTGQADSKQESSRPEAEVKQTPSTSQAETKPETNTDTDTDTETKRDTNARTHAREEAKITLDRFERFWQAYPRHTDKKKALLAFQRLKPDEDMLSAMLAAIEQQKQSDQWSRDGGAYIPHPSTWLNQERWNDELVRAQARKTVTAQQYDQRDYSKEPARKVPDWMLDEYEAMQKEGAG